MPQFANIDELIKTGNKYQRELTVLPYFELAPILAHMTPVYNIQGKASAGTGLSKAQFRPYRSEKGATFTGKIDLREIETYLGDVVEEFDPNELWNTIYGSLVGTKPTETEIAKNMAFWMAASCGEHFASSIFQAKRNAGGDTTMDLYDGFETIIAKEKTAGQLTSGIGNLASLGVINSANIVDQLKLQWRGSHEILQGTKTKLFLSRTLYNMYNDCYQAEHGSLPYNKEFKKTYLEGTDDKCELVPMSGMTGTRTILTVKNNMSVGMDQSGTKEKVEIRRPDNPKLVQFFMTTYFGVQFKHLDPRVLCVGEYTHPEA